VVSKTDNRQQQYSKKVEPMTVKPKQFSKKSHLMGQSDPPSLNMQKAQTDGCAALSNNYQEDKFADLTNSDKISPLHHQFGNSMGSNVPSEDPNDPSQLHGSHMLRSFIIRKATSSSINFNQQAGV